MVTYVIHTFFAGITRHSVRQDYSLLRAKIHPQGSHGCSHAEYMWSALLHDWGKGGHERTLEPVRAART